MKAEGTLVIRPAVPEDIPALAEMYNYEIANTTVVFHTEPKSLEERTAWFYEHNIGNHPLLTAELDGEAAGYACLSGYRPQAAYDATVELSLYVDRRFRRRGIARKLMAAILEEARRCPDIHTVVSVITGENEASLRLHREFGFEDCGTIREAGRKFGRWLDIVNLQLMV